MMPEDVGNFPEQANRTPSLGTARSRSSLKTAHSKNFHPWRSGPSEPYHFPLSNEGNPWGSCFTLQRNFDDEMCKAWREEVDTLLVFAGLFSAAVTAFTVESYRWLQNDAGDTTNLLLEQISKQLSSLNLSTNSSSISQTTVIPPRTFEDSPAAIRINIVWFMSLILALTAVLVGILCKQWLREYQRYESLSPQEAFPVRQMRFEGLNQWHVPKILSALPLLLQAALVLFFAGLLDLLWNLNPVVASVASMVVGLALLLLIATTILPTFQYLFHFSRLEPSDEPGAQCAYKSPQSWAFHLLATRLVSLVSRIQRQLFGHSTMVTYLQTPSWVPDSNWVKYDSRWQTHGQYTERAMEWTTRTFKRHADAIRSVYHCLQSLDNETAARFVARNLEDTLDPVVPLRGMLVPTLRHHETLDQDEPVCSAAKDLIMMGYLLMHQTADRELAERCVEQCIRVGNSDAEMPGSTDILLQVLSIVLSWLPIDDHIHNQTSTLLKTLLTKDKITSSNLPNFLAVFQHLESHRTGASDAGPVEDNHALAVEDILDWLQRILNANFPIDEKVSFMKQFLEGFKPLCEQLYPRTSLSMEDSSITMHPTDSPPELEAVRAMIQTLDDQLAALPSNRPLTSPWTVDSWEYVKQEFFFTTGNVSCLALPSSRPCSPPQ